MDTDKIIAQSIAEEYAPKNQSSLYSLTKLDKKVKRPAKIFAYSFGSLTALIFGFGMCLSMHVIGGESTAITFLGIIIGLIGFALMGVNYLLYTKILDKRKKEYAFEIMELAKKVCDEE